MLVSQWYSLCFWLSVKCQIASPTLNHPVCISLNDPSHPTSRSSFSRDGCNAFHVIPDRLVSLFIIQFLFKYGILKLVLFNSDFLVLLVSYLYNHTLYKGHTDKCTSKKHSTNLSAQTLCEFELFIRQPRWYFPATLMSVFVWQSLGSQFQWYLCSNQC